MQWPETRHSLIGRLGDACDDEAWEEFAQIYEPLIYRFIRSRGVQDADAQDIAQGVLMSVARASEQGSVRQDRGRFRAWLSTVTGNAVINLLQRDKKHWASGGSAAMDLLEQVPDAPEIKRAWQAERQREIFRFAAEKAKSSFAEKIWSAFHETAIAGKGAEQVASVLGMSVGSVYAAKCRVLTRIREHAARLDMQEISEVECDRDIAI